MVDPWLLTYDSAGAFVTLAVPGALWAMLFVLGWEYPRFAESLGLGRRTFWLLLPGALLASYALLPLAPIANDWVAVSLGGAVFPLTVGALALRRVAPPAGRTLVRFLVPLVLESAAMLTVVLPSSGPAVAAVGRGLHLGSPATQVVLVAAIGIAACALVAAEYGRSPDAAVRRVLFLYLLATGVLLLTFAGSSAIPGVGIVEAFPYYLLPPVSAGIVAGVLAPALFDREPGLALPSAFFASTVGVLLGADLLREPPLYGHGAPGLYAIGGAGVLDLVYLSGLLGLAAALATHVASRRPLTAPVATAPVAAGTPLQALRASFRAGVAGDIPACLHHAVDASHGAAAEARRLIGPPGPLPDRPWDGLPVPGWVIADQANLDRVAQASTADPREGYRGWLTARWMVMVGRSLALRRFASISARLAAFAIDLVVIAVPAFLLFAGIAGSTPGGFGAVADSVAFNAAIFGAISVGLLYLVLCEVYTGATVGMWCLGIAVRDRALQLPAADAALLRNLPLAPILSLVSVGGAIAVALAVKGIGLGGFTVLGVPFPGGVFAGLGVLVVVGAGVAILGAIGAVAMALTWERQRVGDLWAGTWVVRDPTDDPGPAAPPALPAPPPPSAPARFG